MKRLFLALAVLAFACGARAQDQLAGIGLYPTSADCFTTTNPDSKGSCPESTSQNLTWTTGEIRFDGSGGYSQIELSGIASIGQEHPLIAVDNGRTSFMMEQGACLRGPLKFFDHDGKELIALIANADYPNGCSKEQHAKTIITNPASAKLLPGAALPPDSE